VILPDTTTVPRDEGTLLWADDPDSGAALPVWSPRKELRCAAVERLRQEAHDRQMAEYNRLLYVALTRAEDRLVVCGWETHRAHPPESWYELIRRGFSRLPGVTAEPFSAVANPWPGEVMRHARPQTAPVIARAAVAPAIGEKTPLPAWAGQAPFWRAGKLPPEPAMPAPLAPSRPRDSGLGPVPHAASPLAARDAGGSRFRRGKIVHALLQHLPDLPAADRAAAAKKYLARPGAMIAPDEVPTLLAEMLAVLENPTLAPLFGPAGRAEVPLTGVASGMVVGGLVDRLAVLSDRVLVADYKTNRVPPPDVDAVPVLYLRQMAAYRAVLRGAFPGRAVQCALVWTTGARAMVLPDSLLDRHAPGAMVPA
jgi:ATP-dependent helicase/nuclease subunit A